MSMYPDASDRSAAPPAVPPVAQVPTQYLVIRFDVVGDVHIREFIGPKGLQDAARFYQDSIIDPTIQQVVLAEIKEKATIIRVPSIPSEEQM